jgi:hypothetical protein
VKSCAPILNKTSFLFIFLCHVISFLKDDLLFCLSFRFLDELLESTVDGGSDVGDILPEVDGEKSTLGDALGSELELL